MELATSAAAVVSVANKARKVKGFWDRLQPSTKAKAWAKLEKHFRSYDDYLTDTYNRTSHVQLIC